jgi:hypothetical protein
MKEAGQDTKEAYNRTLEKARIENETSLKGWFCLDTSTNPANVTAGQAVLSLCF